jgi:hypothetical protein
MLGGLLMACSMSTNHARPWSSSAAIPSSVAKRFGVDRRQWRSVYDPQRSGANPNIVLVGQKFVTAGDGSR